MVGGSSGALLLSAMDFSHWSRSFLKLLSEGKKVTLALYPARSRLGQNLSRTRAEPLLLKLMHQQASTNDEKRHSKEIFDRDADHGIIWRLTLSY